MASKSKWQATWPQLGEQGSDAKKDILTEGKVELLENARVSSELISAKPLSREPP